MNYQSMLAHFGTATAAADALGITVQAVSKWKIHGIPRGRQYEIQFITGGRLRADGPNKPRTPVKNNYSTVKKTGVRVIDNRDQM